MLIEKLVNDVANLVYDDFDNSKEILNGHGNTTLVVRKIMLSFKGDLKQNWLCSNMFQTTCIIDDKACILIIDSDNCENVVSTEVEKLQLKTK